MDSLDALFSLLEQRPREAGMPLPHMDAGDFFVTQTPRTTGRPSLRVLYQIEEEPGWVTIHHFSLA